MYGSMRCLCDTGQLIKFFTKESILHDSVHGRDSEYDKGNFNCLEKQIKYPIIFVQVYVQMLHCHNFKKVNESMVTRVKRPDR